MLVAVIFPEVVLSTAWQQRVQARSLSRTYVQAPNTSGELGYQSIDDSCCEGGSVWTDKQAFFVVMGGLAVIEPILSTE